jgi:uncharacterized protein YdaU (DUF1376 family)
MNYYERHLGDYLKDTISLSMVEEGAYNRLLDYYYSKEQGIPADKVYKIARATSKSECAAVDVVLKEFFQLTDGLWTKGRCQEEIEKARLKISAAQENGRKGGRPKKPTGLSNETQQKPTGLLLGSENETQTITQTKALQTPDSNLQIEDSLRGETPSLDQAIFAEARRIFGKSIGGQVNRAISLKGKPWLLGVIESCRTKDPEAARAYLAAAMNGARKPDEAEQRRAVP